MNKKQLQELMSEMKVDKSSAEKKRELYQAYNAYLKEKSFDGFDEKLASSKINQFDLQRVFSKSQVKRRRIWNLGVSAAAVLVMFGLAYFSFNRSNDAQLDEPNIAVTVDNEIPKVRTEAIAILPNGKEVVLNSEGFNTVQDTQLETGSGLMEQFITLKTPRGGQLNFQLPDGSLVWLNSETTLTYPVSFGKNNRKVELQGEAFFEVVKQKINDHSVSFTVDAGSQQIKVLGTKFNVNNYQNEEIKTTTLVEGSVEVSGHKGTSRLAPNQQFVEGNGFGKVVQVDVQDYVSWKEGIIRLSKQDFPAIARIIERNYNVKFDQDRLPKGFTLNGELLTNVNIDELLKGLGATMGVKFVRQGSLIRIHN